LLPAAAAPWNEILYRFVVIGRGTFGCPGTLIGHPTAHTESKEFHYHAAHVSAHLN